MGQLPSTDCDRIRSSISESLDFPIVLPSRRLAVARRMQVVSAAAAVVLMVGLSAVVGSIGSNGGAGLSAEAASANTGGLHSTEAELRMLYKASEHAGLTKHARFAL